MIFVKDLQAHQLLENMGVTADDMQSYDVVKDKLYNNLQDDETIRRVQAYYSEDVLDAAFIDLDYKSVVMQGFPEVKRLLAGEDNVFFNYYNFLLDHKEIRDTLGMDSGFQETVENLADLKAFATEYITFPVEFAPEFIAENPRYAKFANEKVQWVMQENLDKVTVDSLNLQVVHRMFGDNPKYPEDGLKLRNFNIDDYIDGDDE